MLLLFLSILAGPPTVPETPQYQAETLYYEGSALFEAANYPDAIAKFTEALQFVDGLEDGKSIKLALLYNIASAHEKAYEIDQDIAHLRQAMTLYKRYDTESEELGDQLDAGSKVSAIKARLDKMEEKSEKPSPLVVSQPAVSTPSNAWKKPHNIGIGLLIPGGAAILGGVVVAVVGSRYESNAKDEVSKLADLGVPMDDPAWAEGDNFIAAEKKKGNALMGVGSGVAVLGAVLTGIGISQIVKSRRMKTQTNTVLGPGMVGMQFTVKF